MTDRRVVATIDDHHAAPRTVHDGGAALGASVCRRRRGPAFLVRDGRCVAPPADPWRAPLERHRERIERAIACVGRISSSELARRPALGTAWLVRPDVVVTNTHLARYLDARMRSGATVATVDFIGEHGAPRSPRCCTPPTTSTSPS
jgi:hypothetical protein